MGNIFIENKELFATVSIILILIIVFIILNRKTIKNKYNCGYKLDVLYDHLLNLDEFLKDEYKSKITSHINDMNVLITNLKTTKNRSPEVFVSFEKLKTLYNSEYNDLFKKIQGYSTNLYTVGFQLIKEVNNIYKNSNTPNLVTYNYINNLTPEKSLKCNIIHGYSNNVALLFKKWSESWPQEDYKTTTENISKLKGQKVLTDEEIEKLNSWNKKTIILGLSAAILIGGLIYNRRKNAAANINPAADGTGPSPTKGQVEKKMKGVEDEIKNLETPSPPPQPAEQPQSADPFDPEQDAAESSKTN